MRVTSPSVYRWLVVLCLVAGGGTHVQPLAAQPTEATPSPATPAETQVAAPPEQPGAPDTAEVPAAPTTPELPEGAVEQAFRILMAALLLAVLLENAFALLFNWRLFQEFFVGKAWRTPIMFGGALMIVRTFGLDLMARLVRAFNPDLDVEAGAGDWFTSVITAMVLAGGSVGVNRVLVALGFRSQVRPEALEPRLERDEAFVAIRVRGASAESIYQVNMDVVDPVPPDIPTTLGFVGGAASVGTRLRELLFPVRGRIPRSGGLRVLTTKAYRISVTDLKARKTYDARGEPIEGPAKSQVFAFAPKAIVDFTITIAPS